MIDLPVAKTVFCCLRPQSTWIEMFVREQRVDHEAVGRVDDLLVAEVEHDEVGVRRSRSA